MADLIPPGTLDPVNEYHRPKPLLQPTSRDDNGKMRIAAQADRERHNKHRSNRYIFWGAPHKKTALGIHYVNGELQLSQESSK